MALSRTRWTLARRLRALRAPRVQPLANPLLSPQRQRRVDAASDRIREQLGAFDGDFGLTFQEHSDTLQHMLFEQGREDRSRRREVQNFYVAGSGNSQATSLARARTAARWAAGTWNALPGGSWFDNLHQVLGTGVGGTQQQRQTAYALGLAGRRSRMIAHSQGNLSVENVMQTLQTRQAQVRETAVTGIGSPLTASAGPRSTRVTGMFDPIQLLRPMVALMFGMGPQRGQVRVGGGHGAEGYLDRMPKSLFGPARK